MSDKMEKNIDNKDNNKCMELNVFLKIQGLAATGGQAKILIRSGAIFLNGVSETRNKKKLRDGDIIEYEGRKYFVKV